ncbi:MAG: CGNR zinc finger domain-containing protein [Propionibacteriales bacterium]|nr:CGNR zinc finger domain-containing protein [Propionibacteriales bacterium]
MDFVRYAERAAALLNTPLADADDLREFLSDRAWLIESVADKDPAPLRRLQKELRPIFRASADGDEPGVVSRLNDLLAKHPITPYVAGHDAQSWHLHVSDRSSSVSDLLTAEALLGLAILVTDLGPTRLGVCDADRCTNAFVDTSPNQSRRYCSDRCSSRANVAAYRARRKAEADAASAAQGAAG